MGEVGGAAGTGATKKIIYIYLFIYLFIYIHTCAVEVNISYWLLVIGTWLLVIGY